MVILTNHSGYEVIERREAVVVEAAVERRRAELADDLVAAFGVFVRRFRAAIPEALGTKLGATAHQLETLHMLHHARESGSKGITMNELARLQGCALSSASALADRLLREGLVERVHDADDRRVVRLVPTAKGDAYGCHFAEVKRCAALQSLSHLSVDEMETLVALLRKAASDPSGVAAEVQRG
jgi:DNA-binding MarR family transcriptional regulator